MARPTYIEKIKQAGRNRHRIFFKYNRKSDGKTRQYNVEPYEIRRHENHLWAHHPVHDRIHSFKLDRIKRSTVREKPRQSFIPRWPIKMDEETIDYLLSMDEGTLRRSSMRVLIILASLLSQAEGTNSHSLGVNLGRNLKSQAISKKDVSSFLQGIQAGVR